MGNCILSEDGRTVIVINSQTGEDEQFTVEEYRQMYGEDAVPDSKSIGTDFDDEEAADKEGEDDEQAKKTEELLDSTDDRYLARRWQALNKVKNFAKKSERKQIWEAKQSGYSSCRAHYSAMLELTYAVGDYLWATKAEINSYDNGTYPVQQMLSEYGLRGAGIDSVIDGYTIRRAELIKEVSRWSKLKGYGAIREEDYAKVFKFLDDSNRRSWFRKRVAKILDSGDFEIQRFSLRDLMLERFALEKKKAR